MIKKLLYLVCTFIVLGLIGPVAAQNVDMEIGFGTPVIDGEIDEIWADAATADFVPLADPADGSGIWKVLYDAENLYVLVDITDDSLQNDSASSWQDDSVEIYFDGGNTKLSTPLSGDDHQYTFGWTTDEIQGTNITGYTEGIEQAQVTTGTGWRIEVKMPWMSIWGVVPQAGDLIGIDCYYNDDDDGGDSREGKMLSFSAVEGWNDASQWGTAVLAAIPVPKPVNPGTDGLVAYYALENDANDSSGNGLDGTIVGDPVFVEGAVGMGLQLDGVDDYVDLGNDPLFDLTEQVTLSVWVNTQDIGNTQDNPWLGKGDTSYMIKGFRTGNQIEFFIYDGGWHSSYADVGDSFNGEWHHAAGTFDGEQLKVYVDGKMSGTLDYVGGITPNTYNVAIGKNTQASGRFSESIIDEAMIYNRALSEGEIRYLAGFNLVKNPSFEEDEVILDDPTWEQWATWNPAEGAGSNATIVDTEAFEGARSLLIEPVGVENWHFIVVYLPMPTEVGASYTASFWAKAAEARPLAAQFKANDNSVQWGYTDFQLTTEWAEYSFTAVALNAESKLEIFCAGVEVPFWLDSVTVYKVADAQPEPAPEFNMVNGGFEDGVLDPWYIYDNTGAGATAEVVADDSVEGSYCLHVVVPEAGANFWDVGLAQPGFVFEAGKRYTLSAFLRCKEGTLDINFKPEHAADPWEGYGEQVITMTDQWVEYSVTTPVFEVDTSPGSATFHIGFAAGEFWMDDVKFYESEAPPPVPGENLLPNGGFETGLINPFGIYGPGTCEVVTDCVGAAVPEGPVEGQYCLHVMVPEAGVNDWDVGMSDGSYTFEQGKQYTFSAFLKCNSGTLQIRLKPEHAGGSYEGYGDQVFTMTDTWQEFSVTTPVIAEDVTPASPTFHFAFAPGDFWIDDVKLCELVEQ
jgi:hypothetical protein